MANLLIRTAVLVLMIWLAWTLIAFERREAAADDDPTAEDLRDHHLA